MNCTECNAPMTHSGTMVTLVGYSSPEGHNHDDNCQKREYRCRNGHTVCISRRNRCLKCDWKGKERCWCHTPPAKVDEWPE